MPKRIKKAICPKCGEEMVYMVIYNFGDPNLGVKTDWMKCQGCGWSCEPEKANFVEG